MIIEIKSWLSPGKILFSVEAESLHAAVIKAVEGDADLRGAYLGGANLGGADLRGANLRGADLRSANLRGADLRSANLRGADLRGASLRGADLRCANLGSADLGDANLSGANLRGADLRDADLRDADLRGADLCDANLRDANLGGANLRDADLRGALNADWLDPVREDFSAVLDTVPHEVDGLLEALRAGRVDGSTYHGDCACLVGTVANLRHVAYDAVPGLEPDSGRPIEIWFGRIRPGLTPSNSTDAAIVAGWIYEWKARREEDIVKRAVDEAERALGKTGGGT